MHSISLGSIDVCSMQCRDSLAAANVRERFFVKLKLLVLGAANGKVVTTNLLGYSTITIRVILEKFHLFFREMMCPFVGERLS